MKISDLKEGDLVFTKPKDWLGRLISKQQQIGYSHVGFITSWNGVLIFNESEIIKGVHCSNIKERLIDEVTVFRPVFPFNPTRFSIAANKKVGCKYDLRGILNQLIKEWTGLWLDKNSADNDKAFYCSKYYAYCISKSSDKLKNYNAIDLNDLFYDTDFNHIYTGKL